uniref:Uncharacterized protein n=1 Tax=Oryza brachyantha TaxID=4533 RepID=J3M4Q5_ORYBR
MSSVPSRLYHIAAAASFDVAGESNELPPVAVSGLAQEDDDLSSRMMGYHHPPKEIQDIVDAPPLPMLSLSPSKDKILFLKRRALPLLLDLAKPEQKLAGVRIDGHSNTRSRMHIIDSIIHSIFIGRLVMRISRFGYHPAGFHVRASNTQFVGDDNRTAAQILWETILGFADVDSSEEAVVTFERISILTPRPDVILTVSDNVPSLPVSSDGYEARVLDYRSLALLYLRVLS